MLYIASALTPTPIIATLRVSGLTDPNSTSLVVAKPDKIEVWDVGASGLTHRAELEVWGTIVGIDKVEVEGAKPHILVLTSPPNSQLTLLTYSNTTSSLIKTSSTSLTPPTPTLRQAEFHTSVIAHDNVALVSLWIGVLSCIELEVEKEKDAKKRRASVAAMDIDEDGRRLKIRDNFNINVREHNLLHLSFLPSTTSSSEPIVTFLWISATNDLYLQARALSLKAHSFIDLTKIFDVVSPLHDDQIDGETDFNQIPFSCPAARSVVPIPGETKSILVIGDEHTVLYTLTSSSSSARAPRRLSSASGPETSPRASARRSPQTELVSSVSKRRKSSISTKGGAEGEKLHLRPVWRMRQGFGTVLAATVLESHSSGASVLFGDDSGRLTAIGWNFERNQGILDAGTGYSGTVHVRKVDMGKASPPSSLTYLDSAHLFLSSECGDSQLVKLGIPGPNQSRQLPTSPSSISTPKKGKGKAGKNDSDESSWFVYHEGDGDKGSVEVKERWMNISPVKDFSVVEEEGGGMSHLVISSGACNTNSLRVVRSGVGIEEIVTVEGIDGVERIWPLPSSTGARVLLSTATSTHVLELEPEITISEIAEPIATTSTLAAAYVPGSDVLVQVTPRGVDLWSDLSSGSSAGSVVADKDAEIVSTQIFGELVAVAERGGKVILLSASFTGLDTIAEIKVPSEISSLSIINLATLPSPVLAIGTWTNEILLYTLEQLKSGNTAATSISESFYSSSLLLKPATKSETSSGLELLAGLSDGSLITYGLEFGEDASLRISSRKASSLGTRPLDIILTDGPRSTGDEKIVAVGLTERMSVIFESRDRLDFSSVSKKDVVAATSISSSSLGDVLVLATTQNLSFVKINSLKKLHVQTLDLGEKSVSKIVNWNEKIIATGSTIRTPDAFTGEVLQSSFLEVRDSTTLAPLAEIALKEREEVTCLKSVFLLGRHYLAMGTGILPLDFETDENNAWDDTSNLINVKEGRMVLFEPRSNFQGDEDIWSLCNVTSVNTVGAVYDLEVIHGFLAIAAGSKVSITRLDIGISPPTLVESSSFSSIFIASHLAISKSTTLNANAGNERLVIGDGMRSIVVLDVDEGSGKINDDLRDLKTYGVMNMESLRDHGEAVIIADENDNILTLRLKDGIESAATFGLHEEVVKFKHGSLAPPTAASETLSPELIFATRQGRLGIIGELTAPATKLLDDLQRNMDKYWNTSTLSSDSGSGRIGWKDWRKAGNKINSRDTAGFIDGDFVQKFANTDIVSNSEAERIMSGTSPLERVSMLSLDGVEPAERGDALRVLEAAGGMH